MVQWDMSKKGPKEDVAVIKCLVNFGFNNNSALVLQSKGWTKEDMAVTKFLADSGSAQSAN